jgi:RimJ/RimL family protein N-acetyltransferase
VVLGILAPPDCWGKGFATEIAQHAVNVAFQELSACRVWTAAAHRNNASPHVILELGMRFLGKYEEGCRIGNVLLNIG